MVIKELTPKKQYLWDQEALGKTLKNEVMKINWGTGLAIWLVVFIIFILQFVIRISVQDKYDSELVTENYYEKEMVFQRQIDGETNANNLNVNLKSKKTEEGFLLTFPAEFKPEKITGKISLYRPSNKKLDFEEDLVLSKNEYLIPNKKLVEGRWDIIVFWEYEGEEYFYKSRTRF